MESKDKKEDRNMRKTILVFLFLPLFFYADVVEFSGSAGIYGEYHRLNGDTIVSSPSHLRFDFSPTVSIQGMPISFDFYLNSLESKVRQALNKYRISFQPEKLLRDKVPLPSFVFAVSNVEFGTCYPYFSPYTLSGVPVSGGAVELNPGIFHVEGTMGKLNRGVSGSDSTFAMYERKLYAGSVGFGRKESSHLHFIFLYAGDDTASIPSYFIPSSDSDSVEVIKPRENYIAGIDLKFALFDNNFLMESEIVGSEITRDTRMPELTLEAVPSWLTDIFHPRISSSFDFALRTNSSLNIYNTEIFGAVNMVGPGFQSFGNPYMRNDVFSYQAGVQKDFMDRSISFAASILREHDNLLGLKGSTTSFNSYEFNLGLNFADLPYFMFNYSPYQEKNDTLNMNRKSHLFSLNTGYNFSFSDISDYINFYLSYQNYYDDEWYTEGYSARAISLTNEMRFLIPLTVSFAFDFSETDYPDMEDRISSFDLGVFYTFFERWTNGLGFNIAYGSDETSKKGIYLNSSLSLGVFGNVSLDVERNFFDDDYYDENYDEWRMIGSISTSW